MKVTEYASPQKKENKKPKQTHTTTKRSQAGQSALEVLGHWKISPFSLLRGNLITRCEDIPWFVVWFFGFFFLKRAQAAVQYKEECLSSIKKKITATFSQINSEQSGGITPVFACLQSLWEPTKVEESTCHLVSYKLVTAQHNIRKPDMLSCSVEALKVKIHSLHVMGYV